MNLPLPEEYLIYLDKSSKIFDEEGKIRKEVNLEKYMHDLSCIQAYLRGLKAGVAVVDLSDNWNEAHKNANSIRDQAEKLRWEVKELSELVIKK